MCHLRIDPTGAPEARGPARRPRPGFARCQARLGRTLVSTASGTGVASRAVCPVVIDPVVIDPVAADPVAADPVVIDPVVSIPWLPIPWLPIPWLPVPWSSIPWSSIPWYRCRRLPGGYFGWNLIPPSNLMTSAFM